jgi:hypothetical protein
MADLRKKKFAYGQGPIFGATIRENKNTTKLGTASINKRHIDDIDYDSCYFSFEQLGEDNLIPFHVLSHIDQHEDIKWNLSYNLIHPPQSFCIVRSYSQKFFAHISLVKKVLGVIWKTISCFVVKILL